MKLHEAIELNKDHLDKIANGELNSPEIGRTGWTRRLILSSCDCPLIFEDTKTKFQPTAEDIIADDWNVYPKEDGLLTEKQGNEFELIARPLIKWLNDNAHPHTHVHIDNTSAVLSEKVFCLNTEEYLRD